MRSLDDRGRFLPGLHGCVLGLGPLSGLPSLLKRSSQRLDLLAGVRELLVEVEHAFEIGGCRHLAPQLLGLAACFCQYPLGLAACLRRELLGFAGRLSGGLGALLQRHHLDALLGEFLARRGCLCRALRQCRLQRSDLIGGPGRSGPLLGLSRQLVDARPLPSQFLPQHHGLGGRLGELPLKGCRLIRGVGARVGALSDGHRLGLGLADDPVSLGTGLGKLIGEHARGVIRGHRRLGHRTNARRLAPCRGFDLFGSPVGPLDNAVLGVKYGDHGAVERRLFGGLGLLELVLHLGEALLSALGETLEIPERRLQVGEVLIDFFLAVALARDREGLLVDTIERGALFLTHPCLIGPSPAALDSLVKRGKLNQSSVFASRSQASGSHEHATEEWRLPRVPDATNRASSPVDLPAVSYMAATMEGSNPGKLRKYSLRSSVSEATIASYSSERPWRSYSMRGRSSSSSSNPGNEAATK